MGVGGAGGRGRGRGDERETCGVAMEMRDDRETRDGMGESHGGDDGEMRESQGGGERKERREMGDG